MIEKILISIGVAMLFTAFFSLTNLPKWINFKPFNCNVCLSFWICVIAFWFEIKQIEPFAIAGYAAYFSMILKRIMFKL